MMTFLNLWMALQMHWTMWMPVSTNHVFLPHNTTVLVSVYNVSRKDFDACKKYAFVHCVINV